MVIRSILEDIRTIERAAQLGANRLAVIGRTMREIEQAGMYAGQPTEQWQDRNGKGRYLYMLFRTKSYYSRAHGQYEGPDGKRKLYIGNKPEAIAEARRLAQNRERWNTLDREHGRIKDRLGRVKVTLGIMAIELQSYFGAGDMEVAGESGPQNQPVVQ